MKNWEQGYWEAIRAPLKGVYILWAIVANHCFSSISIPFYLSGVKMKCYSVHNNYMMSVQFQLTVFSQSFLGTKFSEAFNQSVLLLVLDSASFPSVLQGQDV